jgi:DNA polymerase elongation subunit (family B)
MNKDDIKKRICELNEKKENLIALLNRGCIEVVNQEEIDEKFLTQDVNVNNDYILSGSGQYFRKDKGGMFPDLMHTLYDERNRIKNHMKELKNKHDKSLADEITALNNKQLALKILLNSAYGAMASPYFRYFDVRLAKAITLSGQLSIKWVSIKLDKYLREKFNLKSDTLVYNDTDSGYFCFDFVAKKLKTKDPETIVDALIKFSDKVVEPEINNIYAELATYMNCNHNKMLMEREKISEKFLITGKKRYAALVWDDEGYRYEEPALKFTGLEVVRSSTPQAVKPYMIESVNVLLREPEAIADYVSNFKKEFFLMEPEAIAFPRSVSNVNKYKDSNNIYGKGCPIGVRAALIYNKYIRDNNIEMEEISDGDKIKFIYILTPNCFYNQNVFGYIKRIPKRPLVLQYIDYSTQFDKVFYDIIKGISDKVGYPLEKVKQTNLEDLF